MPSNQLSRRELLRRGAIIAGAAGAASLASAEFGRRFRELPAPERRAPPAADRGLRKGISLGGYAAVREPDGTPNDYRLYGNREYIRDRSGTRWVKLWVSWRHLQEELEPSSRAESWSQLSRAPAGEAALRRLDRQLAAINADSAPVGGMGAILGLYQDFPTWSSGALEDEAERAGKPLEAKLPNDLSPEGPWAWFVAYLCARYRRGARRNPTGPSESSRSARVGEGARFGNPYGAWIDALEICNEPNLLYWPQEGIHLRVAEMMRTAAVLSRSLGGPPLLAPGTSDLPQVTGESTGWQSFTEGVLDALGERPPGPYLGPSGAYLGWSHHNYRDVLEQVDAEESRAAGVLSLLRSRGWAGDDRPVERPPNRPLWLTEGGVDMFPRQEERGERLGQARKIEKSFGEMVKLAGVHMWTQHGINDIAGNDFKSGLRDDFVYSSDGSGPGKVRPAWTAWMRLAGSRVA